MRTKLVGLSDIESLKNEFWDSERYGSTEESRTYSGQLDGVEALFAYYCYEDYAGEAFVLYRKDGKFYEVNASHCSCNGLEGCWSPEETTLEAIKHRMLAGGLGKNHNDENIFFDELTEFLDPYWLKLFMDKNKK